MSQQAIQMTSNAYLAKTVGEPLAQCLTELTERCPKDPIEWIAQWLYRYVDKEIYFYEKAIFLKDLRRMRLELAKQQQIRQVCVNKMNREIAELKKLTKDDEDIFSQLMLKKFSESGSESYRTGRHHTRKGAGTGSGSTRMGSGMRSRLLGKIGADGKPIIDPDKLALELLAKELGLRVSQLTLDFLNDPANAQMLARLNALKNMDVTDMMSALGISPADLQPKSWLGGDFSHMSEEDRKFLEQYGQMAGWCSWCLDCNLGLVCNHSVLGQLRARSALVRHETPTFWEGQEMAIETLYDHEIYTTNFEKK